MILFVFFQRQSHEALRGDDDSGDFGFALAWNYDCSKGKHVRRKQLWIKILITIDSHGNE
jgi:hypothetical protein